MKNIFILILAFLSLNIFAEKNEIVLTYSINKTYYNELSEDQKNKLHLRVGEIQTFINEKLLIEIEKELLTKNVNIKLNFSNQSQRDGLYRENLENETHEININVYEIYSQGIFALVAHEFFHAIHVTLKPTEETWVREGLAQLFEVYVTGEFNGRNLFEYQNNPNIDFFASYDIEKSSRALYGLHLMYFHYLTEQCGGKNTFWSIVSANNGESSHLKGIELIDAVLKKTNIKSFQCKNFNNSLMFYEIAKNHNNTQYLSANNPNTFFLSNLNLNFKYPTLKTFSEYQDFMKNLPLFSSVKVPFAKVKELKLTCSNCQITYSERVFPFRLTTQAPQDAKNIDVIYVKVE